MTLLSAILSRKPDIHVPYLYVDMGVAVLCASFMSFGVKRRWFAMAAALQLAVSTYASYHGENVHYSEWLKVSWIYQSNYFSFPFKLNLKDVVIILLFFVLRWSLVCAALQVRMYSRALAIIGGFLVLASGAGEVYRQKPRSRSLQSTGQVFLGVYLICMVKSV